MRNGARSRAAFALRPKALLAWDDAIRRRFGRSYRSLLDGTVEELRELVEDAKRLGIGAGQIPKRVGRPDSPLAKLADEYNWVTITRKIEPPTPESLAEWARWASAKR